jgi:glycosyltransferase involved in cell wall biosynthesis
VLLLCPGLTPYRVDLFNRLDRELDFNIVFLTGELSYHRELNQTALMNSLECEHKVLRGGVTIGNRVFNWKIWREISRFRPDVTISVEYSHATMLTLLYRKSLGRRHMGFVVWTVDNPRLLLARRGFRRLASSLGNRASDSMIVYTDETREALVRQGIPFEKIFICANHQEEHSFSSKLEKARELVEETIRDHELAGRRVLLFVGRLVPVKGLDRLIQAFAKSAPHLSDSVLVMVGDGPERKALESLAATERIADRIVFIGHQEGAKLLVWYLLASVFVLCSDWEPYGAVVNEALMAGTPVLCSSYAGANVLIQEGKNGSVFDPYNIETLAGLMMGTLSTAPFADSAGRARRPNLMPVSFERDVEGFVEAVRYSVTAKLKRAEENCKS